MNEASERLSKAAQQMLEGLEKRHITPQRKRGFLCAAECCDRVPNSRSLQECVTQCELPAQRTAQLVDSSLKDFQSRLQRCAARCQDQAQEAVGPNASDSQVKKAQAALEGCAMGCLKEYEGKLPKLQQDLEQQLKKAAR